MVSIIFTQIVIFILLFLISIITLSILFKKKEIKKSFWIPVLISFIAILLTGVLGALYSKLATFLGLIGMALGGWIGLKYIAKIEKEKLDKVLLIWLIVMIVSNILLSLIGTFITAFFGGFS